MMYSWHVGDATGLVIIRAHGRAFYMQDVFFDLGYADARWWFADALEFT